MKALANNGVAAKAENGGGVCRVKWRQPVSISGWRIGGWLSAA